MRHTAFEVAMEVLAMEIFRDTHSADESWMKGSRKLRNKYRKKAAKLMREREEDRVKGAVIQMITGK